jgi:hypothetical protein
MRIQVIDNRLYDCTPEQLPRDVTDNHDLRKRGCHRHGGYKVNPNEVCFWNGTVMVVDWVATGTPNAMVFVC